MLRTARRTWPTPSPKVNPTNAACQKYQHHDTLGQFDKFRVADNPPGTRTNGSSMSALVCIANGSVPITHRTSADSDACPPTCYWVFGIGASRKSSTIGTASGHDIDHSFPRGRPHREVSFRRRRCSLSFIISFKSATCRISIGPSPYLKPGCCEIS